MDSWKAFCGFLAAILRHWITLMTGGALMAGVGIYEHNATSSVSWSVYVGIIVLTFVVACFLAFKDQYARAETLQTALTRATGPLDRVSANTSHQAVLIEYEQGEPFERRTTFPAGNARFEVYVRVKNGGNGFLSECVVSLVDIKPTPTNSIYTVLTPLTTLQKGEHKYVLVAAFNENPINTQAIYNDLVTFAFATGAFHGGFTTLDPPASSAPALLTIEVKALECRTERKEFKLWVEGNRRLRMEVVP